MCFNLKNDITWVLNSECFLNSEFLCFTLLSNSVKKIFFCQTLWRRANLEKTNLIHQVTFQFCIFDSFDHASLYRCVEQQWYVVWSSLLSARKKKNWVSFWHGPCWSSVCPNSVLEEQFLTTLPIYGKTKQQNNSNDNTSYKY